MSRSPRVPILATLALIALACASGVAAADEAGARPDPPMTWATLLVERDRSARLQVMTPAAGDPRVDAALQRIASRPPESAEYMEEWLTWSIELPPSSSSRLTIRQPLPLAPLLASLATAGQPTLSLALRHPSAGFVTVTEAETVAQQPAFSSFLIPTAGPHSSLALELGWRSDDVVRAVVTLVLAMLLPIAAGLIVRHRAFARPRPPEAWFVSAQWINVIMITGWVLWWLAVDASRVGDLLGFALQGAWAGWFYAPAWMMVFLPACFALAAIQRDVTRRLRGVDPMPRGSRFGLQVQARMLVPLLFLVGAIAAFGAGHLRAGVFALIGAVTASVFLRGGSGPLGLTPQALSTGALRDRLFEMAHRAGVTLRDLYVVPLRRERLANAFAVNGGVVMVADEMLDRMSRREVDALLAHEISHLEHHHPLKGLAAAAAAGATVLAVSMAVRIPFSASALIVAAWLTHLFVARRFEFAADAGAAALTGDPEGVISGLGRLARLNDSPLTWGRSLRWLVTHPTTEARGLAVGRRAGLAPERVRELLAEGLPPGDHYGHAERPGEEARVFSTQWKGAVLGRLSLATLVGAAVAPAALLAVARSAGWVPLHLVVIPVAFAATLAAVILVHDRLAARPVAGLEAALRQRLGDPGERTIFVCLSPGDQARVYEGFLDWDLGVLVIEPERLHYRGEQVTFELPRWAVRTIEIGATAPGWIRAPRVVVRWSAPTGEASISLRAGDARRVSAIGPTSRALAARLSAWHGAAGPAGESGVVPPAIGPVTFRTLAEVAGLRDLPILFALIGAFTAGAAFLLGLDLWHWLDMLAAGVFAMVAMRWPAMTARERPTPTTSEPASENRAA